MIVLELGICLLRIHSSSWIFAQASALKDVRIQTDRCISEIGQARARARTHTHTHTHMHTNTLDLRCRRVRGLTFFCSPLPLSEIDLQGNKLTTLPSGIFSGLSALRLLACLCESERECVRLFLFLFLLSCILIPFSYLVYFTIFPLFSGWQYKRICASLTRAYTCKYVDVSSQLLSTPFMCFFLYVFKCPRL